MRTQIQHSSALPLETVKSLLEQYSHQILSLEADLKERARLGSMKQREFTRRLNGLRECQLRLRVLQRRCAAESGAPISNQLNDIPLLARSTPLETEIYEQFFAQREALSARLERDLHRVHKWLMAAVTGRSFSISHVLRLSKLHRLIGGLEKRTNLAQEFAKGLGVQVEKLLMQMSEGQRKDTAKSSIEGLVTLFSNVENLIARIAKLRGTQREEEQAVANMTAWLGQASTKARQPGPQLDVPTPLASLEFARQFQDPQTQIREARVRRGLAAAFWREVVLSEGESSDSKQDSEVLLYGEIEESEQSPRKGPSKGLSVDPEEECHL